MGLQEWRAGHFPGFCRGLGGPEGYKNTKNKKNIFNFGFFLIFWPPGPPRPLQGPGKCPALHFCKPICGTALFPPTYDTFRAAVVAGGGNTKNGHGIIPRPHMHACMHTRALSFAQRQLQSSGRQQSQVDDNQKVLENVIKTTIAGRPQLQVDPNYSQEFKKLVWPKASP